MGRKQKYYSYQREVGEKADNLLQQRKGPTSHFGKMTLGYAREGPAEKL